MSLERNGETGSADPLTALRLRIEEARTQSVEAKPFMADFYLGLVAWGENMAKNAAARRALKRGR